MLFPSVDSYKEESFMQNYEENKFDVEQMCACKDLKSYLR